MDKVVSQKENQEITLVDVAAIACREWKIAAGVFFILMAFVIVATLFADEKYAYSSIYKVAEQQETDNNPQGALEQPSTVAEKIRTVYVWEAARVLLDEWGMERLEFDLEVNNPNDTLLVVLTTEATESMAGKVNELHKQTLEQAKAEQQSILLRLGESLESRRLGLSGQVESLTGENERSELAATYVGLIADIDAKLAELSDGKIVRLSERSVEPVGLGPVWMLLFGIIVSVMMALVSAWLMHFIRLVAKALRDDSRTC
ncbi:hypothetical protein [Halomonas sp.]|uniref:hypothetical protein n=1 Tax=Halomonas sp. TaxID=1486246 RepID=UPI00384FA5FF